MSGNAIEKDSSIIHDLPPEAVNDQLENGDCLLIDVREPGEFEAERIPGALLFPLSEFDPKFIPFEGKRRVIFHCGTGKRSRNAALLALQAGAPETAHLEGGLKAWKKAGLPLIIFDPDTGKHRQA